MKVIFFNIVLWVVSIAANAQTFPDIKFSHLTENDGLSSRSVTSVTQDGNGIIWVGTNNGLNRFDGYGFAKFYSSPYDHHSITANGIENICSDHDNQLWIMTLAGICRFDIASQKATRFRQSGNVPLPFRINDGSTFWFDKGNTLPYIISQTALYHFTSKDHYQKIQNGLTPFSYKGFSFSAYQKIVEDKKGQLWAFRQNKIFRINQVSKKVENEYPCPDQDINIYDIVFDSSNRCWVSSWASGLYTFIPGQNKWIKFPIDKPTGGPIKYGTEWKFRNRTFLLFAISSPGLLCIDEKTLQFHIYPVIGSVGDVNAPFVDRQNILWVPTSNGLYYYSPSTSLFDIIPIVSADSKNGKDPITTRVVYGMKEEKSGYWISLRYIGGILHYNSKWKFENAVPDLLKSFGNAFDDQLATTREGFDFQQMGNTIFVTTEWGIMTINLANGKREIYQYPGASHIMRLRTIVPENDQKWWIRSFDQGVFLFNPQKRKFIRQYKIGGVNSNPMPNANYMIRDIKGRIFVSTTSGLYQYHNDKDSFLRIVPKGRLIIGTMLMGIANDNNGIIWIGTDNGLVAFDPDSGKVVKTFSENNRIGLVQRITIDSNQNVWFNSNAGYWCWLRNRNRIIQFKFSAGLPLNDGGMFYTTREGGVYAGGNGAVVRFYPDRLMNYSISSQTRIIEAFSNDSLLSFGSTASGVKKLLLKPDENNLAVHFDVINYDQLDNSLFLYKLEPGQSQWKTIENGRLSFNNLAPGDYELSVRGGNKLTGNFTNTDMLYFTIQPFWFQTWWFVLLCVLIAGGIISFFVFRHIKQIRKQAALTRKIAETEMMALRSQMNPHFIFNSLNGIEYFIMSNEKRNASVYLNKFASLIRIILSDSREEVVPFTEDMESIRLYVDLEQLRFNHKFCFITDIDEALNDGDYRVPPLLIQPFVENAIIHGFASSDKKDLKLKISAIIRGEYVIYSIEDNGVGRKKSASSNLLNRPKHASLGIQITQQRISIFNEQHHGFGSIDIEDLYDNNNAPAGTRITVKIKSV